MKHLCHLLDKLTLACIDNEGDNTEGLKDADKLAESDADNLPSIENSTSQPDEHDGQESGRNSPGKNKEEDISAIDREKESYVSFDVLSEGGDETERLTDVRVAPIEQTDGGKQLGVKQNDFLSESERIFSEFTTETENFYYGAGDDPLLLDCTNYIHFELDKDKVVVFNISRAYKKNLEILSQYAISTPRSDDMPKQTY